MEGLQMLYKRDGSKFYWYKFMYKKKWHGGSTKTSVKRKAETFQDDVRSRLRRIELGLEDPNPQPVVEIPTFADYSKNWLNVHAKVNCKQSTYRLNKQILEDHLSPIFGKKKLGEISRADVEAFIADMVRKRQKATVRNIVAVLRGILSRAVRDEIITTNRASNLGRFQKETSARANAKKIVPLSPSEVKTMLEAAERRDLVLYVFLLTAVLTGMRAGELFGLQWGDIDRVNKCIHVKRSASRRRIETPKNHTQRRIDMADDLLSVLETLRARRKEDWFKQGKLLPEWVFCTEDGNFVNEYNFRSRKFYPLITKAKLRRFRIHDLRHTYASIMLQNGESLTYVKEQMGHHSIQITVDTYGHLIPGANRAASDRLSATVLTPVKAEQKPA